MREKVKTTLEGFGNSGFPRIVDKLNTICDGIAPNDTLLEEIASKLKNHLFEFSNMTRVTTEDGCACCSLFFKTSLGKIAVLFPDNQDRSVAIYANGTYQDGPQDYGLFRLQIQSILEGLHKGLSELVREQESKETVFIEHI
ncbi:hypothetical protein KJA17_02390 [Patescibacteria group bacterium]|nr:hypothetical protein [Patescibacteria group bacterium]